MIDIERLSAQIEALHERLTLLEQRPEAEFIHSFEAAPAGRDGKDGKDGARGERGPAGKDGPQGPPGPQGEAGPAADPTPLYAHIDVRLLGLEGRVLNTLNAAESQLSAHLAAAAALVKK